ncbi:prepilin-type N-terminal cleavage/methylation domain-containing protein [Peptococcus simiae]|uniref:Prepilin-type N-terminal cleavage/methylation domain-containing protein n=1 Tax=Peptococcus simiae TaxID=1643805 RepID=A0ABW9GZ32_9FIRM
MKKRRALTLVECLMVLLIMSLLILMIMPAMQVPLAQKMIDQEGMKLYQDLRTAQLQVAREGGYAEVRTQPNGYTIRFRDNDRPDQVVQLKSRVYQSGSLTFQQENRDSSRSFPSTFTLKYNRQQRYIIVDAVGRIYYRQIYPGR